MLYKVRVDTVRTAGWEMDYVVFGEGARALVILPGISLTGVIGAADAIAAAYADFSRDYTVYVFERRRDIRPGYTVRQMAEDTAIAMRYLNIADADVFGASQGGMIAQWLAVDAPRLVHAMVLAASMMRPNDRAREVLSHWAALADTGDVRALNREVFDRLYTPGTLAALGEGLDALLLAGTAADCARFALLCRACLTFDMADVLDRVHCPALVIGAENDRVLSGDASVELAARLGCALYMYADYGHAVYDEAPDFRARISRFLAESR